jgi:hypothetical protein
VVERKKAMKWYVLRLDRGETNKGESKEERFVYYIKHNDKQKEVYGTPDINEATKFEEYSKIVREGGDWKYVEVKKNTNGEWESVEPVPKKMLDTNRTAKEQYKDWELYFDYHEEGIRYKADTSIKYVTRVYWFIIGKNVARYHPKQYLPGTEKEKELVLEIIGLLNNEQSNG